MRRSSLLLLGLLLVTPTLLLAQLEGEETCRDIWREFGRSQNGRPRAVYCEVRDLGVLPKSEQLDFDGYKWAGVRVHGERRPDVRVQLVIHAQAGTVEEARDLAKAVKLDISSVPLRVEGVLNNRRDGDDDGRRWVFALVALTTPEQTNLRLRTSYAHMEVANVAGKMDLMGEYGPISLRDVGGDVRVRADYGPIDVDLSGAKWQGRGLDAVAAYGPMTLRLPRNFGADLEIGADHGPLDVEFPLTLRRFSRSLIQTKLGDGGPQVRAIARYGPMSLKMSR